MNKTVALHTLGCKLNFSETSAIADQFIKNGFSVIEFDKKADVYVFNTCTVTENAEKECRQIVRRALRINPDAYVIVTGCYAQLRPEEISAIDGVNAVLGSNEKFKVFEILNDFNKTDVSCVFVSPTENLNGFGKAVSSESVNRTRAFFKIQDGCDYKCSFCTIPLARGKSRSMEMDELIKEFKKIINDGYKEIILTGVNVGDFKNSSENNLLNVLENLIKIDGDFRIRISSIEPNLLSDEIIYLTAESEKLCKHFHIPLQSGSNEILRRMQRRYTVEDYKNLITKIRNLIPQSGIGVDVIVGFPGETDELFEETYNFLSNLHFSYLHVFTYSERPFTKAISMSGKVPVEVRRKRNNSLRTLSDIKKSSFYNSLLGTTERVLFESDNSNGIIKGFTSNYVRVACKFNPDFVNTFQEIHLTEVKDDLVLGEALEINNYFAIK
jgi:threonylcarbamoyladenosine tRNA methylthiotransferase MtaB